MRLFHFSVVATALLFTACSGQVATHSNPGIHSAASSVPMEATGDLSMHTTTCSTHNSKETGALSAEYDAQGHLTGWSCVLGTQHSACTAGPDGIWKECTYPPDVMRWPDPVPKDIVKNPPPPTGAITGIQH